MQFLGQEIGHQIFEVYNERKIFLRKGEVLQLNAALETVKGM
jgi:hypothetical protein